MDALVLFWDYGFWEDVSLKLSAKISPRLPLLEDSGNVLLVFRSFDQSCCPKNRILNLVNF